MIDVKTTGGDVETVTALRQDPETQQLLASLHQMEREQAACRKLRILAGKAVQDVMKDTQGINCPEFDSVARKTAAVDLNHLQESFEMVKGCVLARVKVADSPEQSQALVRYTEELVAQNAAALIAGQLEDHATEKVKQTRELLQQRMALVERGDRATTH